MRRLACTLKKVDDKDYSNSRKIIKFVHKSCSRQISTNVSDLNRNFSFRYLLLAGKVTRIAVFEFE